MVLKFHRDALSTCAGVAKKASGAFNGLAGGGVEEGAFGKLPSSGAIAAAAADLVRLAGTASKTMGSRLEAVDRALDAVEQTVTSADGGAVRT